MSHPRYRDIDMPERFVLECLTDTGAWIDWDLYHAEAFQRDDDGTYVFGGDGSPLYLRCLRQDGCVIYVVDGAGDPYTYRLVTFPGGGYS
jgi:hypothetical protein